MKPSAFTYHRPRTLGEALQTQAELGAECKVLAGGQSLIPMLNMRLAAPAHLMDINGLSELDTLTAGPDGVVVGALARHRRVERESAAALPLLAEALGNVAHPVIRNRGTTVGSIAHADPASETTAVLALLQGSVELASVTGRRTVPAADFFVGTMESSARPDEVAVSARFPAPPPGSGTAFVEVARRHGDYAMCGVAALVTLDRDRRPSVARFAYLSMGAVPEVVELGLAGADPDGGGAEDVAAAAVERMEPEADLHATAEYRAHLARVLTLRALRRAADNALEGAR